MFAAALHVILFGTDHCYQRRRRRTAAEHHRLERYLTVFGSLPVGLNEQGGFLLWEGEVLQKHRDQDLP